MDALNFSLSYGNLSYLVHTPKFGKITSLIWNVSSVSSVFYFSSGCDVCLFSCLLDFVDRVFFHYFYFCASRFQWFSLDFDPALQSHPRKFRGSKFHSESSLRSAKLANII